MIYVFNKESGYFTYSSIYDYLCTVITEEYIDNLLDDCYGDIEIPILGMVKVGEILKSFNYYGYLIEDEINVREDEIDDCLENEGIYEMFGPDGLDLISFSKEKLEEVLKEQGVTE